MDTSQTPRGAVVDAVIRQCRMLRSGPDLERAAAALWLEEQVRRTALDHGVELPEEPAPRRRRRTVAATATPTAP